MTTTGVARSARRPLSTATRAAISLGILTALWCASGIGARATYNTRTTADEPQYLLSAISLFEDGDLDIADERVAGRFLAFHEVDLPRQETLRADGTAISPHDPLLPVLLAVPVAVGGWIGAKVLLALVAGLLAAVMTWTAVTRYGARVRPTVLVVGASSLAAPLAVYGTQVYPEIVAALTVAIAIAAITGPMRRLGITTFIGAIVALPWLSVKYAPVAVALAAVAGWRLHGESRRRALVGSAVALTLAGVAFAVAHGEIYGGLTPYASGTHFRGGELTVTGSDPDVLGRTQRLIGLLVDREFGLIAWAPVLLLIVPALAAQARAAVAGAHRVQPSPGALGSGALSSSSSDEAPARVSALALVVPIAAGWANATWVALTMHGWWWPGRQVVVVVPCAVLALASWVGADAHSARTRGRIVGVGVLGSVGVLAFVWQVVEVLAGHHRLIIDFTRTEFPVYRIWRHALPDLRDRTRASVVLAAAWTIVVAALAVLGWRGSRRPRPTRAAIVASSPPPGPAKHAAIVSPFPRTRRIPGPSFRRTSS